MATIGHSITRNIGLSWIGHFLYVATQVARIPLLYRIFEEHARGTWFLMISIIGFLGMLELGLGGALTRYYARSFGLTSSKNGAGHLSFEILASNAKTIFSGLGMGGFVVCFVAGYGYLRTLDIFHQFTLGILVAWLLLSVGQGIAMTSQQYSALLNARGYVGMGSLIQAASSMCSIVLLIPALLFRGSLVYVSLVDVLRTAVVLSILRQYCRRHITEYFPITWSFNWSVFVLLLRNSLIPSLAMMGAALVSNTDSMYISSLLDIRKVSDYYNSQQLVTQLFNLCTLIMTSALPSLFTTFGGGDIALFRSLYHRILKYSVIFYAACGSYVLFTGKHILELWLGPGHYIGFPVLSCLVLFYFMEMQNSLFQVVQFSRERYPMVWTYWFSASLRFGITLFLIRHYGLVGVVLGKLVAQLCTTDWFSAYFCLKSLEAWPFNRARLKKALGIYCPVFVFLTVGYATRISAYGRLPSLILQTCAYGMLALPALFIFMDRETRERLSLRFRRLLLLAPEG